MLKRLKQFQFERVRTQIPRQFHYPTLAPNSPSQKNRNNEFQFGKSGVGHSRPEFLEGLRSCAQRCPRGREKLGICTPECLAGGTYVYFCLKGRQCIVRLLWSKELYGGCLSAYHLEWWSGIIGEARGFVVYRTKGYYLVFFYKV